MLATWGNRTDLKRQAVLVYQNGYFACLVLAGFRDLVAPFLPLSQWHPSGTSRKRPFHLAVTSGAVGRKSLLLPSFGIGRGRWIWVESQAPS